MKKDKILESFVPKHERIAISIKDMTDEERVEFLEELEAAEWGELTDKFERGTGRGTLVTKLPRTLDDISIGVTVAPLDVDPKNTVANVIEPDKEIEWKDVKEKG